MHSVKFQQKIYQENLILKKILMVTVIDPFDPNDPLNNLLTKQASRPIVYLQSANKELQSNPGIKSMLERKTLFDTIFSDMLAQPNTQGYAYLLECFTNYLDEKDKAVNKEPQIQEMMNFLKEMTLNYASLLALNPDIYPMTLPQHENYEGIELTAFRLCHLLESNGYVTAFMGELNQQIKLMDEDGFKGIYQFIFSSIRKRFQSSELTIFDPHACKLMDVIANILNESDEMKEIFV